MQADPALQEHELLDHLPPNPIWEARNTSFSALEDVLKISDVKNLQNFPSRLLFAPFSMNFSHFWAPFPMWKIQFSFTYFPLSWTMFHWKLQLFFCPFLLKTLHFWPIFHLKLHIWGPFFSLNFPFWDLFTTEICAICGPFSTQRFIFFSLFFWPLTPQDYKKLESLSPEAASKKKTLLLSFFKEKESNMHPSDKILAEMNVLHTQKILEVGPLIPLLSPPSFSPPNSIKNDKFGPFSSDYCQ